MLEDLCFGARILAKHAGFTLIAVLTLAGSHKSLRDEVLRQ
jgi:hypothetical protein